MPTTRSLLIEAYVRPGTNAKDIQPFAAALKQSLPELAGVVMFATSAIDDETRQRAPLTAVHGEAAQTIGEAGLLYDAAGADYQVSGGSFFQTNRYLIDKLVEVAVSAQTGRTALDLYAGSGLFTRHLARNFDQVIAVEASAKLFRGSAPQCSLRT